MANDVDDKSKENVEYSYPLRKVSALSLGAVVKKPWAHLIRNTTDRCAKIEYLASTFFNFHLIKMLSADKIGNGKEIDNAFFSNVNNVRPFFVSVCDGCYTKNKLVNESLDEWKKYFSR